MKQIYSEYTFEFAAVESGVDAKVIEEIAKLVATAGTRFSSHNWRSVSSGVSGGWSVARCLFMLNALLGAVATEGGVYPNAWNKFVPRPIYTPPHPQMWNETTWPREYPLSMNEMSFLLPHFLKDGRSKLDVYFTRVYNPVWTNPDGFSWIEMLTDPDLVGCYVALTPTWNETAYYADYVLPMGVGSERHDLHSYETHDSQWLGFRQPVMKALRQREGKKIDDTREVNPGEVWEENEFWLELTWRIDPDGSLGIRQYAESKKSPGTRLGIDEYYAWIFENSVPGLPERASEENLTPLEFMRRYGAYEVKQKIGRIYDQTVGAEELDDVQEDSFGRVFTRAAKPAGPNIVPLPLPDGDADGRRLVGINAGGEIKRGFPTPSGRLEFYSSTMNSWGWPEYAIPGYIKSHVHPDNLEEGQTILISTFRLAVQIHTRSANSKWLDEIAHTNPLWIHPSHAKQIRRPHGRAGPRRNRYRLLRRAGVGHGRNSTGHRRVQSPHGPLETDRRRTTAVDGDRETRSQRNGVASRARKGRSAVPVRRSRHVADLVEGRGNPSKHDVSGPSRSDLRHALLASGGAGAQGRTRRRPRRYICGY